MTALAPSGVGLASDRQWAEKGDSGQMTHRPPSPSFARDIMPMFRPDDIACMRPMGVRLNNPDWMTDPGGDPEHPDHANARRVFAVLKKGSMPPDQPWSNAWLAIYDDWMANGFAP
ncbi:hypothetical protein [Caulobacter sp. BE254]|uniref:hypothetical protein n=1 Tax=Caulobacter sp. BE254 TaxID=2817720 RepID=UPI002856AA36|nr:hypothetical protein [Caulobacter sp. BE254]MDR7116103.1 hypothetical protein [Caulobacter sp. BE254]